MKLTPEQIQSFDEQGYVFFPNCFSEDEVAVLRSEADSILRTDRREVWREKTGAPRTAFAAHTYNEAFRLMAHHPRLVEPMQQLFGEGVYVHQFKINAKAAFEGDVWQWHQDYGTWARDDGMPEPRAMNISIFLDEVLPINGPLMLIPKSHKHGTLAAGLSAMDARPGDRDAALRRGGAAGRHRHRGADRQAGLGADVSRQSRARIAAEHHALPAQDRVSHPVRRLQPHHQIYP
jgi:ectoine hydroxylase-related dioxygenase (phytanoyl-CoA dioxygenase family)